MKLNPTQKETILKLKAIYEYENKLTEKDYNTEIEDVEGRFISIILEIPNDYYYRIYALIGKRGKILHVRKNGIEYEENDLGGLFYNLKYTNYNPIKSTKSKPIPSYYGIEMYKMESTPNSGLKSVGIRNNKITKKFFNKYYPDSSGISIEYAYMRNGGDGILKIVLPDYTEKIYFGYYPQFYDGRIYTYNASKIIQKWDSEYNYYKTTENSYKMNYEEEIKSKLTNRQIIAKVFKIYLKHNNLL